MITFNYEFEGTPVSYTIERDKAHLLLYEWVMDNWSHDDFIDYILMRDTETIDLLEDFKDELQEMCEELAEEEFCNDD